VPEAAVLSEDTVVPVVSVLVNLSETAVVTGTAVLSEDTVVSVVVGLSEDTVVSEAAAVSLSRFDVVAVSLRLSFSILATSPGGICRNPTKPGKQRLDGPTS
jgi:hypothetical protein